MEKEMKMRPHNTEEIKLIYKLIREGEGIHGRSDKMGPLVQEHVQKEMVRLGKRVKFPTPKNINPFPK